MDSYGQAFQVVALIAGGDGFISPDEMEIIHQMIDNIAGKDMENFDTDLHQDCLDAFNGTLELCAEGNISGSQLEALKVQSAARIGDKDLRRLTLRMAFLALSADGVDDAEAEVLWNFGKLWGMTLEEMQAAALNLTESE